jgi:hypothetical protein
MNIFCGGWSDSGVVCGRWLWWAGGSPGIFDLRFAIVEQRAKQGSLTIESDVKALKR